MSNLVDPLIKDKGEVYDYTFYVSKEEEWDYARTKIVSLYQDNNFINFLIVLTDSFSVDGSTQPTILDDASDVIVTIRGAGYSITLDNSSNGNLLNVTGEQQFTIHDVHLKGKVNGDQNTGGSLVYIDGGIFNMTGNSYISGNITRVSGVPIANNGGGVYVENGGIFNMKGGTISDNIATNGGGVSVENGGTFNMNNGTIKDNTATTGGGVYVNGGIFKMSGSAEIYKNTGSPGGGVLVTNGSQFTMSGGTIGNEDSVLGNSAAAYGGGVGVTGGSTFTMTGGFVKRNKTTGGVAGSGGGGVYVSGGGSTFTMIGGTISGNTAQFNNGGGVNMNGGTFTMTGGNIYANTAIDGGGVFLYNSNDSIFRISSGTIAGDFDSDSNIANNNGNALYVLAGSAQHGTFGNDGITWNGVDIIVAPDNFINTTIKVQNGVLQ